MTKPIISIIMDQYTMLLRVQVNKLNRLELDQEHVAMLEDIAK